MDPSDPSLPAEETEAPARSARKTPPPLPAFAQQPSLPPIPAAPALPSMSPAPAPRSATKTVGYIALFIALVAVAIVAGRSVGNRSRAPQASAPAESTTPGATISAGAPAPSDSVLMVPTIEMK
jgi:hypothetical protein